MRSQVLMDIAHMRPAQIFVQLTKFAASLHARNWMIGNHVDSGINCHLKFINAFVSIDWILVLIYR